MVLYGKDRQLLVTNALHRAVVEVYVAYLQAVLQAIGVNGVAVVLSGDVDSSVEEVADRVVSPPVSKLQLESPGAKGSPD